MPRRGATRRGAGRGAAGAARVRPVAQANVGQAARRAKRARTASVPARYRDQQPEKRQRVNPPGGNGDANAATANTKRQRTPPDSVFMSSNKYI